ncbi:hypothetical protein SEA_HONK_64 [Microbacterium phage Honk]|uniref:Uncharacterized protein n=1 Tax=Microbacterium phage Honk TaxID=2836095 RepID=A0A8F3E6X9_9CAUD|nr:hypothetical protein SEA_HONK_64 [Microbacterium phage Honk]
MSTSAPAMPVADEAKVARLMSRAATMPLSPEWLVLDAGAPVDVFEAARRLGFVGELKVVPRSNYVRVRKA